MAQDRRAGRRGRGGDRPQTPVPSRQEIEQIVGGDVEKLVTWADSLGRGLAHNERLTTSQVRGFFGAVRQIEAEVGSGEKELGDSTHRKLVLLKPKLAYQAQREIDNRKGEGVLRLKEVLAPAIELVGRDATRFRRFVEFFEAILAYHKAAGGRES
jgi:CRISPR-associated protein Csm2